MPSPFLPRQVDNTYRGQRLAFWILGLLALVRHRALVPFHFALLLAERHSGRSMRGKRTLRSRKP